MIEGTRYRLEFVFLLAVFVMSILGFWDIYFAPDATPQMHHHLHLLTVFAWLGLLASQLSQIARGAYQRHRKTGKMVLVIAPILVGTTAMLTVHSAQKGVASGEGDFLIIQNVMGTFWLALFIILAFAFRRRRLLHGAFLMSTAIIFMGVALFFVLISFAPPFRIEGPETFYRFQTAAMTGQLICLGAGLVLWLKSWRSNWPYVLAALSFLANEAIKGSLAAQELIDPLTLSVASLHRPVAFLVSFIFMLVVLSAFVRPRRKPEPAPLNAST